MSKTSVIATIALVVGLVGAAAAAEARGGHHGHHNRHFSYGFIYSAPVYVAPTYTDCSYAYWRWQSTASFYWKKRYYACKGWW